MSTVKTALISSGLREDDKQAKPILQSPVILVASTLTGAFAGAAMGKPSFYSGLATTLLGVVTKIPVVTSLGAGMMISGGYKVFGPVGGTVGTTMMERIKAFGQDFKERLYLDKIFKPQDEVPAISGFGNVQYFKYPVNGPAQLDMSALDKIQKDLAVSAMNFQQTQMRGIDLNAGDKLF